MSSRDSTDAQNAIRVLVDQRVKDFNILTESLREYSAPMKRFALQVASLCNDKHDTDGENPE